MANSDAEFVSGSTVTEQGLNGVHLKEEISSLNVSCNARRNTEAVNGSIQFDDGLTLAHSAYFNGAIWNGEISNKPSFALTGLEKGISKDAVMRDSSMSKYDGISLSKGISYTGGGQVDAMASFQEDPGKQAVFRGLKVLLAEDNLVNQKVACKQLKKFGTEVDVVTDGQQCLNALEACREKYDLILMDVQMPVLDGLQATEMIRAKEKEHGYPRKPIIGLTAHAIQGYKDKCIEAGMDAYTCKPFQVEQLVEVIQRVIAPRT